jgi:hypothetical protein
MEKGKEEGGGNEMCNVCGEEGKRMEAKREFCRVRREREREKEKERVCVCRRKEKERMKESVFTT